MKETLPCESCHKEIGVHDPGVSLINLNVSKQKGPGDWVSYVLCYECLRDKTQLLSLIKEK